MAPGYLITVSSTTQLLECGPASEGFFIASWPDAEHDSPLSSFPLPVYPPPAFSYLF